MSHMMCHNDFIGSQMFDSSCVCFRVCIWDCIASHDMIGCIVMWKSIQLCLAGIHAHMGLMFTHDSSNHGFT